MSYNGSGTFQINTSGQPVVAGTVISSTAFNALTADLATGLSTAITKDGQTTTTVRIPFAAGINSSLTTDSSSTTTGSIITAGGVGIVKNLNVGANANIAGTLGVTGVATFSAAPIYSSLTASSAVATDASKGLVSVTNTGTGNNVLATSPTLVTPILGTPTSGSLVNCTDINYTGFKNRIINGAMVIDQRNAGASVTATVTTARTYVLDRWGYYTTQASKFTVQQNAGSVTPPAGFRNYIGITSSSAYTPVASDIILLQQAIEGYNVYDLNFGSASASTITFSFWVRSSLTGTFAGSLGNSANSRLYPFTFTISSADTWEQKTITVTGDTSGTWVTDNGIGLYLNFNLGTGSTYLGTAGAWTGSAFYSGTGGTNIVATNGATFYITGVQLEKGSTATSFDYRPYGTELALCQRYYFRNTQTSIILAEAGFAPSTTSLRAITKYPVPMRAAPTALEQTGTGTDYRVLGAGASITACNSVPTFNSATVHVGQTNFAVASGLTAYAAGAGSSASAITAYLGWSAEL